jgi:hypothetical protein
MPAKHKILDKILIFFTEDGVPVGKLYKKKYERNIYIQFFAFLKSMKKVVGSGSGSVKAITTNF